MELQKTIQQDYKNLKAEPVSELREIYKRSHGVCDLKGVCKIHLVADILVARYGRKNCKQALNW